MDKLKIKILENLKLVVKGSNKLPLNNLEILVNSGLKEHLLGGQFIELLNTLKMEGLITSNENNWYFSITQKGLDYLAVHSK
ncbi:MULTISPECIES: hypothetical protein [Elizabethkingia]|uniref:ArnR1-like winged helix-turn-helix domain-containing protein n=1 Tax=Elizabethkingia miricola TaxID=172045 RepID=A0ABD4DGH5_ELIMR|nr:MULTISPECIES: hypothetical protein [Elizabethkingia]EQB93057.1 hypothetical protein C874_16850 [Elizabethkingia anophelis 502]KUY14378.1 hypothetical protein ATB95_18370 [Elizabethkingia miricola]MCL1654335.1 hypothetical protein [Elizabethkingia miricola]MCL1680992.1 hypothetical protein [Elizabethkingia miricola]MCT3663805.1 hypothetical protein [Elizabethkingia anophelis]